jgi:ABC-2 type transport system permease protein
MAMMMGRQQSPPKGDIKKLWDLLGVDFAADTIVWQKYNPYPKFDQFPEEFVFVEKGSGVAEPFNATEPISSGLQQVLFPFPGSIRKLGTERTLEISPLAITADKATGTIRLQMIRQGIRKPTNETYVLAARIRGEVETPEPKEKSEEEKSEDGKTEDKNTVTDNINVVLVADVDMLSPAFFEIREKGNMPELGINFEFDNVTFVLNVLDELAGNRDFLEIRKRRRIHRPLEQVQKRTEAAREASAKAIEEAREEYKQARSKVEKELSDKVNQLNEEMKKKHLDMQEIMRRLSIVQQEGQKRMDAMIKQLEQKRDKKIQRINAQLNNEIVEVQNSYRILTVLLPPIPPLLLAIFVYLVRRSKEREGVSHTRMR